jgi:pimeloyl-ACP methyl ester carboxylesterase
VKLPVALLVLAACSNTPAGSTDDGAPTDDGVPADDASDDSADDITEPDAPAPLGSRCTELAGEITCDHSTTTIELGFGSTRDVHYQVPLGTPPAGGWRGVILFQGSLVSAERAWSARPGDAFGGIHQTETVRDLLDAGYAVITPEARFDGSTYWDTNTPTYAYAWSASEDATLMQAIFDRLDDGSLGAINPTHLAAIGISSGGYMTSRVAITYPDRFSAAAVHSASYMTCSGSLCAVPSLPDNHPPTLFLQGTLDNVAPASAARLYYDALVDSGLTAHWFDDANAGHEWLAAAPAEALAWFAANP